MEQRIATKIRTKKLELQNWNKRIRAKNYNLDKTLELKKNKIR